MAEKLIVAGAKVFDGTEFIGKRDVIAVDGVITEITAAWTHTEKSAEAEGAQFVDGTGRTLTPGLIDCHVHVTVSGAGRLDAFTEPFSLKFFHAVENLRRTLHAGVTTARDAGGADAGVKAALAKRLIEGPKLRAAISIMSQTGGHGDGCMASGAEMPMLAGHPGAPNGVADGIEGVTRKAREILRAGADQIKICSTGGVLSPTDDPRHSQFTVAEIEAIVAEAETQGAYVMSHAQGTQGIRNALEAGVRSIEHGIFLDQETIELFIEKGAYLVPTLQAPVAVIKAAEAGAALPPAVVEKAIMVAETHREAFQAAYAAGVKIAMGTDAGVGPHGENLEELELMFAAGMTAQDALRAATANAADLIGSESVGRIAEGKAADLVLFDGDLAATGLGALRGQIEAVFQDGVRRR
ncbi:metal-dependent hydrolase family protein [Brevibacterium album]|uniref:metal-dependent hydrolase family protein n=1 Tax=Brevibacterium album TaxID=417948 RepID=UPI00041E0AFD|nr:amidohydrolase family protein [Brevibacterium album]